jgi:signal transduction histidine kinase
LFPPDFAAKITADDWSVVANGIELKLDEDLNGRHYHTIKYPITHGNRRLLAGYTIDITDRKTGEVEISLKNRELEKAIAEKDKFFSIIAHDLRTPFTAFLGFTRMMVEDLPTLRLDEIQKFALIMRNSATNLYTLLENLLEWSRIQRGIIGFDPSPVLLGRKAAECLVSVMESASKKGIEFNIKIPDDLTVIADGNMLGSILRNLTTNAVKYTPKGGEISLSAKPIGENQAEISVCDNGIGMSKELMDKLFHLDEHSSRKGTDGEASTGLGLIICKDFVNKNGGIIRVESEVGEGSTFSFTLPALHRTPVN